NATPGGSDWRRMHGRLLRKGSKEEILATSHLGLLGGLCNAMSSPRNARPSLAMMAQAPLRQGFPLRDKRRDWAVPLGARKPPQSGQGLPTLLSNPQRLRDAHVKSSVRVSVPNTLSKLIVSTRKADV